ncbi:hypothetical protein TGFOU_214140 [Toxoplasma gondii FOU]|uniref:Uncharacterized protein n=3 Tax=Toxoplasma gondii TaxID=5811 RepID=A0A086KIZ7_TOXGO|nr:hypothetical protein TGFOU_214140 [Toxoplasma gondii FOU]RQX70041.1 hypothetical protein TGCAST_214140 [Toxoplasma gondii CAST]
MRAKSERVYKPGAKEEWRVVYWIYPQEKLKNNRKQVSFSSIKYGDQGAQNKAWAVIRYINHFGRVPEDIKNPPMTLEACCNLCYPHCIKEHVASCPNCVDPPTERYHHGVGSPAVSCASSSAGPSPGSSSAVWRKKSDDKGEGSGLSSPASAHPRAFPTQTESADEKDDDCLSSLPDLTPLDSLSPMLSASTCDLRAGRKEGDKSPPLAGDSRRNSLSVGCAGATASPAFAGPKPGPLPGASPLKPGKRSANSSRRSSVSLRGPPGARVGKTRRVDDRRAGTEDGDLDDFASSPDLSSVASSASSPLVGVVTRGSSFQSNPPFSPLLLPGSATAATRAGKLEGLKLGGPRSVGTPSVGPAGPPPVCGDSEANASGEGAGGGGPREFSKVGRQSRGRRPSLGSAGGESQGPIVEEESAWGREDQTAALSLLPPPAFSPAAGPAQSRDEAFSSNEGREHGGPPHLSARPAQASTRSLLVDAVQQLLSGANLRKSLLSGDDEGGSQNSFAGRSPGDPRPTADAGGRSEDRQSVLASSAEALLMSLKKGARNFDQEGAQGAGGVSLSSTAALLAAVALRVKEREAAKAKSEEEPNSVGAPSGAGGGKGKPVLPGPAAALEGPPEKLPNSPLSTGLGGGYGARSPLPGAGSAAGRGSCRPVSGGPSEGGRGVVGQGAGEKKVKEDEVDQDEQIQRLHRFLNANGIVVTEALQAATAGNGPRKAGLRGADENDKALVSVRARLASGPGPASAFRCAPRTRGNTVREAPWRPNAQGGPPLGASLSAQRGSGQSFDGPGGENDEKLGEERKDEGMVNVYQVYAQHILHDMGQSQVAGARDGPDPLKELLRASNFFAIDARKRLLLRTGGCRGRRGDDDLDRSGVPAHASGRTGESPPLSPERRAESRAPTPPEFGGAGPSSSRGRGCLPAVGSGVTTRMTTRAATRASRGGCGGALANGGEEDKETPWMCNGVPVSCRDPFLSEDKDMQQYYNCGQYAGDPWGVDRTRLAGLGLGASGLQTRRQGLRSAATEEEDDEKEEETEPTHDPTTFNWQTNSAIRQQKAALKLLKEITQWGWKSIYEHEDFFLEKLVKKQLKTAERVLENEIVKYSFPQLVPVLGADTDRNARLQKGRSRRKDGLLAAWGRESRAWLRVAGDGETSNGARPAEEADEEREENAPQREVRIEPQDFFSGCDSPVRWGAGEEGDLVPASEDREEGLRSASEERWRGELVVEQEYHMIHGPMCRATRRGCGPVSAQAAPHGSHSNSGGQTASECPPGGEGPVGSLCEATAKQFLENPEEYSRLMACQAGAKGEAFVTVAEALGSTRGGLASGREGGDTTEGQRREKTPLSLECLARLLATAAAHRQKAAGASEAPRRWRPRSEPARDAPGAPGPGGAPPQEGAAPRPLGNRGTRPGPYCGGAQPVPGGAEVGLPARLLNALRGQSNAMDGAQAALSLEDDSQAAETARATPGGKGSSLPMKAWLERLLSAARQTGLPAGPNLSTSVSGSAPAAKAATGSSCASALIDQVTRLLAKRQEERRLMQMREVERKLLQMRDEQRVRRNVHIGGEDRRARGLPGLSLRTQTGGPQKKSVPVPQTSDREAGQEPQGARASPGRRSVGFWTRSAGGETPQETGEMETDRGETGGERGGEGLQGDSELSEKELAEPRGRQEGCTGEGSEGGVSNRLSPAFLSKVGFGRNSGLAASKPDSGVSEETHSTSTASAARGRFSSFAATLRASGAIASPAFASAGSKEERGSSSKAGVLAGTGASTENGFSGVASEGVSTAHTSAAASPSFPAAAASSGAQAQGCLGRRVGPAETEKKRARESCSESPGGGLPQKQARAEREGKRSDGFLSAGAKNPIPPFLSTGAGGSSAGEVNSSSSSSGYFSSLNEAPGPCWTGEEVSTSEGSLALSFSASSGTLSGHREETPEYAAAGEVCYEKRGQTVPKGEEESACERFAAEPFLRTEAVGTDTHQAD